MKTTPAHDFHASYALAINDESLRTYLKHHLGSGELAHPNKSDLVESTAQIMNWTILQARKRYANTPERLVGAIACASEDNAYAVWSTTGKDWIIVSEGLMESLRGSVDDLGQRFAAAFPELMNAELMRCLLDQTPLRGGFRTTLGSYLYYAAISFLVGHEAGHHVQGHDGYFTDRGHAEAGGDVPAEQWLTRQALERDADKLALNFCQHAIVALLSQLWDAVEFTDEQRRDYQRVLAALISVGVLAVTPWFKPRKVDWKDVPGKAHPPELVRVLSASMSVSQAIKQHFKDLDTAYRRWIRIMSLEITASASIAPGSTVDKVLQERLARGGEPAAIRATGFRGAIHDPELIRYVMRLEKALREVRPRLKPRSMIRRGA